MISTALKIDESGNGRASDIRAALDRSIGIVERRPSRARGTAKTRVSLDDGLTCQVEDGEWNITLDMPERHGGRNAGPNPGVFGRAALGSCMAMVYMRWAAKAGLPIDRLEVEIEADYDARGELGVAPISPAYTAVRATIHVESPAPEHMIRHVFELAEERCPYLQIWENPLPVLRDVRISNGREG